MLRFVVLHHTGWPGHTDHFDLMLQKEEGSGDDSPVLTTYSTERDQFPSAGVILAPNHDHRRAYLTFEGELSQQRGRVRRVDAGTLEWLGTNHFRLMGTQLSGEFRLVSKGRGTVVLTAAM